MNIMLVPSSFPTSREPKRTTYIRDYACSLGIDHQVTVVYPQQVGTPEVGDNNFFVEDYVAPNVKLVNYTYQHIPKTWMMSYLAAFRRVFNRIRKIDVIFAHIALPAGPAALLLGRLFGLPVILIEHTGPVRDWLDWTPHPRRVQYKTLTFTYSGVDYLGAVSGSLAREINEVFGATVHGKLYNPVDCDLFRPNGNRAGGAHPRVLCVTRGHPQDWRKGVPNLLTAWEIVRTRSSRPVKLDLVGEMVELLAPDIEARGLKDSCGFHSWVPAPLLAQMIRESSLVVIPSSYETFGRSGVEALACGIPVVATRCGGPEEYVEDGMGILVPTENPDKLAEGILIGLERRNFESPEVMARHVSERFSYRAVCQRFTDVATGLIRG